MIYCGDFTFPFTFSKSIFQDLDSNFLEKPKIINFESTLSHLNKKKRTNGIALSSSKDSRVALNFLNVKCTSHANNHSLDYDFELDDYLQYFKKANIQTIGIGKNIEEASKPFVYEKEKLVVLSFGWETIRCKSASTENTGISPYKYAFVQKKVNHYRKLYPEYKLILFPHWNYEFETCPSPADRKFSHHLIDIGVDGIFGHHTHIINCFEVYKEKPIFYSLGNFYFPQVKYGNYTINFRETALHGISVEYDGIIENMKIHYHVQDKFGENIKHIGSYGQNEIPKIDNQLLQNISNISENEYYKYYIKNRFHKRKGLPVYKDYNNNLQNKLYDSYVKLRQIPIDLLEKAINILS